MTFPFKLQTALPGNADKRTPVFKRENYPYWTIEIIVSGAGFLEINGESFQPGPGDVYILSRGSFHRYYPDYGNPWQKLFFVLEGELVDYLFKIYGMEQVYYVAGCDHLKKYFDLMMTLNIGTEDTDHRAAVIFHQFLAELAGVFYAEKSVLPTCAATLKKHLDSSLENPFELKKYAIDNDCSSAYLIRAFRESLSCTPYEYLMQKRIDMAKRYLEYSPLSIKEIADRLCFANQYYFSNYFRKRCGVSPTQFRNDALIERPAAQGGIN